MFERFNDRARRVVALAQEEARALGHDYIGTEHILLALTSENAGIAAEALASVGMGPEILRGEIEKIIGRGEAVGSERLAFSQDARKILERSLRVSLQLRHRYVGTEHILLGLLTAEDTFAQRMLTGLGVDVGQARSEVLRLCSPPEPAVSNEPSRSSAVLASSEQHEHPPDLVLSEAATAAMRHAAEQLPPGSVLTTGQVLAALALADPGNDWQRVWLHTGDPEGLALAEADDVPEAPSQTSWQNVPLSASMAATLSRLARICGAYSLSPASAGLFALAIVADPDSGATKTLLRAGPPHAELVEMIQDALVGSHLVGFMDFIGSSEDVPEEHDSSGPGSMSAIVREAKARAAGRQADELDLIAVLSSCPASKETLARLGLNDTLLELYENPVRMIGLAPMTDLMARPDWAGGNNSPLDCVALLAASPSPGLSWLFRLMGVERRDVAAEAMEALNLNAGHRRNPTIVNLLADVANVVASLAVSILIGIDALGPGSLWGLLLVPLVWLSYPKWPSYVAVLAAIPVFLVVTPLAGFLQAGGAVADWVHMRAERREIIIRTGVIVSPAVTRRVTQRRLITGRFALEQRQAVKLRWLEPRLRRAAAMSRSHPARSKAGAGR